MHTLYTLDKKNKTLTWTDDFLKQLQSLPEGYALIYCKVTLEFFSSHYPPLQLSWSPLEKPLNHFEQIVSQTAFKYTQLPSAYDNLFSQLKSLAEKEIAFEKIKIHAPSAKKSKDGSFYILTIRDQDWNTFKDMESSLSSDIIFIILEHYKKLKQGKIYISYDFKEFIDYKPLFFQGSSDEYKLRLFVTDMYQTINQKDIPLADKINFVYSLNKSVHHKYEVNSHYSLN